MLYNEDDFHNFYSRLNTILTANEVVCKHLVKDNLHEIDNVTHMINLICDALDDEEKTADLLAFNSDYFMENVSLIYRCEYHELYEEAQDVKDNLLLCYQMFHNVESIARKELNLPNNPPLIELTDKLEKMITNKRDDVYALMDELVMFENRYSDEY